METPFDQLTVSEAHHKCSLLKGVVNRAAMNIDVFTCDVNAVMSIKALFVLFAHDYPRLELELAKGISILEKKFSPAFAKAFEVGLIWGLTKHSADPRKAAEEAAEWVVRAHTQCQSSTGLIIDEAERVAKLLGIPASISNANMMLKLSAKYPQYGMLEREARKVFNINAA